MTNLFGGKGGDSRVKDTAPPSTPDEEPSPISLPDPLGLIEDLTGGRVRDPARAALQQIARRLFRR